MQKTLRFEKNCHHEIFESSIHKIHSCKNFTRIRYLNSNVYISYVSNLLIFTYSIISGRHGCLWCLCTASEMQKPRATRNHIPLRTLENLKEHVQSFRNSGSNPKSAKYHYNVLDEPLFNIPLEQVILLLYQKH